MRGNAVGNAGARPNREMIMGGSIYAGVRHARGHKQFFLSSGCDTHPRRTQLGHTPNTVTGAGHGVDPGQRQTDQCAIRLP
jgi:hypothetical protein